MPDQSIYERLDATQRELASIVEELGSAIYEAIERVTLNRVAIAAGLDHTVESTKVIEGLGEALRHERDVNLFAGTPKDNTADMLAKGRGVYFGGDLRAAQLKGVRTRIARRDSGGSY